MGPSRPSRGKDRFCGSEEGIACASKDEAPGRASNSLRVIRRRFDIRMIPACLLVVPWLLVSLYSQDSPLGRAESLLKQGQARDALQILLELHRGQPSNASVCQQIGIAYAQL